MFEVCAPRMMRRAAFLVVPDWRDVQY